MSADLWRIIHVDDEFKQRFRNDEFQVKHHNIRGREEQYVEINVGDRCVRDLSYLINYIKKS